MSTELYKLIRPKLRVLNAYDLHKKLINDYNQYYAADKTRRDESRDKRDTDVIRENHKFLWEEGEEPSTWEERLAKKYYDKLYKEYCICDLVRYKEGKVAMRWQTETELVTGKGQFVCGDKKCYQKENLKSWEVNFGYEENGEKKYALVKLRLCEECSIKLNYKRKMKEAKSRKRLHSPEQKDGKDGPRVKKNNQTDFDNLQEVESGMKKTAENDYQEDSVWKGANQTIEEKSRDEDFEEFLDQLLL